MTLVNRWAADAFLKSYTEIFAAIYDTTTSNLGAVQVAYYGDTEVASFELEFFAVDAEPAAVVEAVRSYPIQPHETYVLNVAQPNETPDTTYTRLGFQYKRTYPLYGIEHPAALDVGKIAVFEVKRPAQAMYVNETHMQHEPMPVHIVGEPNIRQFFAKIDGQAVGWIQLIQTVPNIAYINNLYTLPDFRRRGVAGALLNRVHQVCTEDGITQILLVPSEMAQHFYTTHGYQPLLYFSVWRPAEQL
ncbi:MAG: GNAT family N-acetyltransferase [Chloroflexi bacterium]|nr:GNAT family N-acetyltransferase [Chloroflexota bacterium]